MPLRSAAVSRILRHGFPPPLNPGVQRTTCTRRTDITKSRDLAHKTRVVLSAIKTHTYPNVQIHALSCSFSRAARFPDRVSDVSGNATCHCDIPENIDWKRCLTFCASAGQTNKHEVTEVAIRGDDGHETSREYSRRKPTAPC